MPSALTVVAVLVALAALLPVVYLVLTASQLGLAEALDVVSSVHTLGPLASSMGLAVGVAGSSAAIGGGLAWLVTRTDLPGRQAWRVVTCLPLVLPSYLVAFSWASVSPGARGVAGAWLVLTLVSYPLVLLPVAATIGGIDPAMEETARSLGDNRRRALRRALLPQMRPALATGTLLVALFVISDFGAVALLEVRTLTIYIYLSYLVGVDPGRGALLGCLLGLLALSLVVGEARCRGRAAHYRLGPGSARPHPLVELGRWRWPAMLVPLAVTALALGVPGVVLGRGAVDSAQAGLDAADVWRAARASATVALAAGALTVAAALPVALLTARRSDRLSRMVERSSYLAHCLPGVVVALSMIFFTVRFAPIVYRRPPMLVFSYLVLFLPLAVSAVYTRARQVPPLLGDVARALGRRPAEVWRTVTAPLLAPGIATGLALVFLAALKEIPVAQLVSTQGFETLALRAFSASEAGALGSVAVPSIALVILAAVAIGPLLRHANRAF